jgi:hypothetical protein
VRAQKSSGTASAYAGDIPDSGFDTIMPHADRNGSPCTINESIVFRFFRLPRCNRNIVWLAATTK